MHSLGIAILLLFAPSANPQRDQREGSAWISRFLEGSRALEARELELALPLLEEARQMEPRSPAIPWSLALLHARQGSREEALYWLEVAVEEGGGDIALLEDELLWLGNDEEGAARLSRIRSELRSRTRPAVASLRTFLKNVEPPGRLWPWYSPSPVEDEVWCFESGGPTLRIDARTGRVLPARDQRERKAVAVDWSKTERRAELDNKGHLRVLGPKQQTIFERAGQGIATESQNRWSWKRPMVSLSPDGTRVLVSSAVGRVALFEVDQGKLLDEFRVDRWRSQCTWSPGGLLAYPVGARCLVLWDTAQGGLLGSIVAPGTIGDIAFGPDERLWYGTGDLTSLLLAFDPRSGKELMRIDLAGIDLFGDLQVHDLALSTDGTVGVGGAHGMGHVFAWEPSTGELLWQRLFSHGGPSMVTTAFGPRSGHLYVGAHQSELVDARDGSTILTSEPMRLLGPVHDETYHIGRTAGLARLEEGGKGLRWERHAVHGGEWVLRTPRQWMDGTPKGIAGTVLSIDGRSAPLTELARFLLDPVRTQASIAGRDVAPAQLPSVPALNLATQSNVLVRGDEPTTIVLLAECEAGIAAIELVQDNEVQTWQAPEGLPKEWRCVRDLPAPPPRTHVHYEFRARSSDGISSSLVKLTLNRL